MQEQQGGRRPQRASEICGGPSGVMVLCLAKEPVPVDANLTFEADGVRTARVGEPIYGYARTPAGAAGAPVKVELHRPDLGDDAMRRGVLCDRERTGHCSHWGPNTLPCGSDEGEAGTSEAGRCCYCHERRPAERWAVIELMGHKVRAGKLSDATVAGTPVLRLQIPDGDGFTTEDIPNIAGAIYRIRYAEEEIVRQVAAYEAKHTNDPIVPYGARLALGSGIPGRDRGDPEPGL